MNLQVSERDKKLLILLGCVLLLAGSYYFGFVKYGDKRAEVEAEITELDVRYNFLLSKDAKRKEYLEYTEQSESEIKKIAEHYPSRLTVEKEIIFGTELEAESQGEITNMTFTDMVVNYSGDTSEELLAEGQTSDPEEEQKINPAYSGLVGYKSTTTMTFKSTYQGLKDLIAMIQEWEERKTIDTFSVSYDKTNGLLSGTMTYSNYAANSEYSTYKEPDISAGSLGVENLFDGK